MRTVMIGDAVGEDAVNVPMGVAQSVSVRRGIVAKGSQTGSDIRRRLNLIESQRQSAIAAATKKVNSAFDQSIVETLEEILRMCAPNSALSAYKRVQGFLTHENPKIAEAARTAVADLVHTYASVRKLVLSQIGRTEKQSKRVALLAVIELVVAELAQPECGHELCSQEGASFAAELYLQDLLLQTGSEDPRVKSAAESAIDAFGGETLSVLFDAPEGQGIDQKLRRQIHRVTEAQERKPSYGQLSAAWAHPFYGARTAHEVGVWKASYSPYETNCTSDLLALLEIVREEPQEYIFAPHASAT